MDNKDLIIQKMQELIDHYWHYHDCSRCHEIKIEIARLSSRLEPEPILLRGVDNPERIALMEKYGITEDDVTEFINGFKPKVEPDKPSA